MRTDRDLRRSARVWSGGSSSVVPSYKTDPLLHLRGPGLLARLRLRGGLPQQGDETGPGRGAIPGLGAILAARP